MDIFELARIIRRQWRFVVPVLAVTTVFAVLIATRIDPDYEAVATVLVELPSQPIQSDVGDSTTAADAAATGVDAITPSVLSEIMTGDRMTRRVEENGGPGNYNIAVSDDGILTVVATSNQSGEVVPTVRAVLDIMNSVVSSRQSDSANAGRQRATVEVLSEPLDEQTVGNGRFRATGSAILNTPSDIGVNPFTGLAYTTRLLEVQMASEQIKRRVLEGVEQPVDYVVERIPRDDAPLVFVTATGSVPASVTTTLDRAIKVMKDDLRQRQLDAGFGDSSSVTLDVIARQEEATLASTNLLKPLVVILGMGIAAAAGLAVLADTWFRRRRTWKRDSVPPPSASDGLLTETPRVDEPVASVSRRRATEERRPPSRGYGRRAPASQHRKTERL